MGELEDYYNKDAKRFWSLKRELSGRDRDVFSYIKRKEGVFLDYGCGAGSLLYALGSRKFERLIGVDLSRVLVDSINSQVNEDANMPAIEAHVVVDDNLHFLESESVDSIACLAVIEHVINPYKTLDELFRVSKPGGELVLSVPNYAYLKHVFYLLFNKQPRTGTDRPVEEWRDAGWDGMHLHTFTKSSLETLLNDCGWRVEFWCGSGTAFNFLGIGLLRKYFPSKWSGELIVRCSKPS
jgi:SAM-dependent methyltransferase